MVEPAILMDLDSQSVTARSAQWLIWSYMHIQDNLLCFFFFLANFLSKWSLYYMSKRNNPNETLFCNIKSMLLRIIQKPIESYWIEVNVSMCFFWWLWLGYSQSQLLNLLCVYFQPNARISQPIYVWLAAKNNFVQPRSDPNWH